MNPPRRGPSEQDVTVIDRIQSSKDSMDGGDVRHPLHALAPADDST